MHVYTCLLARSELIIIIFMLCIQRGTPTVDACDKSNSQPHIVNFHDIHDDGEDVMEQFFIAIEQTLMMECSNLFAAFFYVMAAHYIFNLSYNAKIRYVLLFLQEKVCGLPSTNVKRTPTVLTHFAGVTRFKEEMRKETSVENVQDELNITMSDSGQDDDDMY